VGFGFVAHLPWQAAGSLRAALGVGLALVGLGFVAHLPPHACWQMSSVNGSLSYQTVYSGTRLDAGKPNFAQAAV
jgi:hypothetical protein